MAVADRRRALVAELEDSEREIAAAAAAVAAANCTLNQSAIELAAERSARAVARRAGARQALEAFDREQAQAAEDLRRLLKSWDD